MVRKLRRYTWLLLISIVLILATGGYLFSQSQSNISRILDLKRTTVETKDLRKVVISSGRVVPVETEQVLANNSGKLVEVRVEINDPVTQDQLLAKIETRDSRGRVVIRDVLAPRGGTITREYAELNQTVISAQTPLFEIINLTNLRIEAAVVEADIDKVALDQRVDITIPALDDVIVVGKIESVALTPLESLVSSPSYEVVVTLAELPAGLKIGMNADLEIEVDTRTKVLAVSDAYVYKQDGKSFLKTFKREGNNIELNDVEVTTGFRGESDIEITAGVEAGTEVVLPTEEIRSQRGRFSIFSRN